MFVLIVSASAMSAGVICLYAWYGLPLLVRGFQVRRISRICRERGLIALTYDDGPSEALTARLLEVLDRLDAKGTFFVTGREAELRPDEVRRLAAGGHAIGSHSDKHCNALKSTPWHGILDCLRGIGCLQELGIRSNFYRPPYGKATLGTLLAARSNGCRTVWWTHDSGDTGSVPGRVRFGRILGGRLGGESRRAVRGEDELVASRTTPEARQTLIDELIEDGGVVLLHDSDRGSDRLEEHTLSVTRELIEQARQAGRRIVTLEEVFEDETTSS